MGEDPQGSIPAGSAADHLPLQDRVAIVTGGSGGIGRAIALHLCSLGARIVVSYSSNSGKAEQLASQINAAASAPSPTRAVTVKADVSDPNQVKTLFDAAESAFNCPVNIFVNSGAVFHAKNPSIAETSVEDFDRIFSVNARGAFLCCREAANRIKRGGGGRIICITSATTAALRPNFGAYTASKAAVEAMVPILAKELKGTGITANCVAPGATATEYFFIGKTEEMLKMLVSENPQGRLGLPEDIAPMVGFLATDAGGWVNGQVIRVNGGVI
ncbi:OLC1v1016235C1 [Oldenlandia corymbosa var. corymbosa]|uniref:OLC1v1016235C1 n=1 Tax=Oldenlandia corymbosa var. corymbosa TaxID=529605 RepID=A0AAV1E7C2_OLDCO|nr:OLC1v1016235C1 [Oldenlandia corymbosa var. corymbosa]